jgi:hypothetical protein
MKNSLEQRNQRLEDIPLKNYRFFQSFKMLSKLKKMLVLHLLF